MDCLIHCHCTDAWFHGYGNWYDSGIRVALLTTVFGLIVAIILQIFYNYIVSKVDSIVGKMEESSIALVEVMDNNNVFK